MAVNQGLTSAAHTHTHTHTHIYIYMYMHTHQSAEQFMFIDSTHTTDHSFITVIGPSTPKEGKACLDVIQTCAVCAATSHVIPSQDTIRRLKETDRERKREREREIDREKKRARERERWIERQRERERERVRETERERERET